MDYRKAVRNQHKKAFSHFIEDYHGNSWVIYDGIIYGNKIGIDYDNEDDAWKDAHTNIKKELRKERLIKSARTKLTTAEFDAVKWSRR